MAIGRRGGSNESLYKLSLDNSDYLKGLREAQAANGAFEAGAAAVGRKLNQFGSQFAMMGNSAKRAFAEVKASSGSATEQFSKFGMAIGVATLAFKRYVDLLKSGTGEGAAAIGRLETSWDSLVTKIGTAESNAFRPLIESLDGATTAAGRSAAGIETLGIAAATATNPILGLASALMHLSSVQGLVGGRQASTAFVPGAPVPDAIDVEGMAGEGLANQGPLAGLLARRRQAGLAGMLNRGVRLGPRERGAGGGGGGGDDFGRLVMEQYNAQIEAQRAFQARVLDEQKTFEERRIEMIKAAATIEKMERDRQLQEQRDYWGMVGAIRVENSREQDRLDEIDRQRRKQEQAQMRSDAMAYADIVGGFAQGLAGSHAAANWIKAGTETLDAVLSVPNWVEVARHGANAVMAGIVASQDDARAGKHKSQGPLGISGGGGGGGGGPGAGSFAPGATGGGGAAAPQTIVIQIPGVYTTERGLQAALVGALGSAADAGYQIPGRAIPERRR